MTMTPAEMLATIARQDEEIARLRARLAVAASIAENISPAVRLLFFDAAALREAVADRVIDLTESPDHLVGCPLRLTSSGDCVCSLIAGMAELAEGMRK